MSLLGHIILEDSLSYIGLQTRYRESEEVLPYGH